MQSTRADVAGPPSSSSRSRPLSDMFVSNGDVMTAADLLSSVNPECMPADSIHRSLLLTDVAL